MFFFKFWCLVYIKILQLHLEMQNMQGRTQGVYHMESRLYSAKG